MDTKKEIARKIKLLRQEKNLTQQKLSELTGITLRSIINYENAVHEPNSKSMVLLENFFNVSGSYLRGETEERDQMVWDDSEIMDEVEKQLISSMKALSNLAIAQTDANKKILFNFFVEFRGLVESLESNDDFYLLTETMIKNFNTLERIIRHSKSSQD
ncbi:helix-turn-helix domain-containing protein [Holdemanella sp. MSK.7.32]|uniref:helix-turn-helix domain-containing protein n=1 Tax=Holdemanella sp. MSK.7.32 TaxID=2965273 RepID=UPI00210AF12F|nr:helix-turn-helix transcriptional regulator [Holdemanella sp. MSK.7.32]MCQ4802924.1 helix-turn-helix domain-containing protein [Holdemanella sp. MSK.7.32]